MEINSNLVSRYFQFSSKSKDNLKIIYRKFLFFWVLLVVKILLIEPVGYDYPNLWQAMVNHPAGVNMFFKQYPLAIRKYSGYECA